MRLERSIYAILVIACATFGAINWRRARIFMVENEALRAHADDMEAQAASTVQTVELVRTSSEKLRAQTGELLKLRGEVTTLRTVATNATALATENQRLRAENQQLQTGVRAQAEAQAQSAPDKFAGHTQFPRNSWSFAGYTSPEAALVSAIWAMREGNPKTYLDSLAPEEQQRVAQNWQNKTETELAEKHKSDVSTISGLRVLSSDSVGPNEVVMNVLLEGANRTERVRMNQVGQDWKFGGYVRDQQPAAQAPAVAK
jgi:hypothetical protein